MLKKRRQPFMTPVEIVRIIASAIGVKSSNKQLDTFAYKYDQPYTLASRLFNETIVDPLSKSINKAFSIKLEAMFESMIQEYIELVNSLSMDGVFREETQDIITRWVLDTVAVEFNLFMGKVIDGPNYLMMNNSYSNGVSQALDWLSANIEWWDSFQNHLTKEKRHQFKRWDNSTELPKFSSIAYISNELPKSKSNQKEQERVRVVLLASRYFDNLQRSYSDIYPQRLVNTDVFSLKHVEEYICYLRERNINWLRPLGEQGLEIDYILYKKKSYAELSDSERKRRSRLLIDELELSARANSKFNMNYWINWYRARWHALDEDFKEANILYNSAFEQALFFAGPSMPDIINEALSVASSLKPSPDKVFIKRLKNAAITFGIDIPLHKEDKRQLDENNFESVAEEWEVSLYEATLNKRFPTELRFSETSSISQPRVGPLITGIGQEPKPNFRSPNKKIFVGGTWQKKMPQIVYFSSMNKKDVVSKLLEVGANVNALSDSNESALLFSISQMDVLEHGSSMDDSLFHIVSSRKHHADVVNTKTSKKKLLPIVCAVDTGRPEVVAKVIEMGANVNFRGNTDNQTALFATLCRITMVKRPSVSRELLENPPISDELFDSIRRDSNGLMGASLDEVKRNYMSSFQEPSYQQSMDVIRNLMFKRVSKLLSLKDLRKIAMLLIQAGADCNAAHKTTINGFTPLMLAAELDEVELFRAMLQNSGDPKQTAEHPDTGLPIDSFYVAQANKSIGVVELLSN